MLSALKMLVSPLVKAGLSRMLDPIKTQIQMGDAWNGNTIKCIEEVAIDALERLIGNDGQLTENMDKFLHALLESGLMSKLCDIAALYTESELIANEGVEGAFFALYKQYIGGGKQDSINYYKRIVGAMSRAFHQNTHGAWKNHQRNAVRRNIIGQLEAIDKRLASIFLPKNGRLSSIRDIHNIDPDEIDGKINKISQVLISRYEKISVYGPDMKRKLANIDHIYISPTLTPLKKEGTRHEAISGKAEDDSMSLEEFSDEFTSAVVLGNPGGGKSTLAQKLALLMARNTVAFGGKIPIIVIVRDYEKVIEGDPQVPLEKFVINSLSQAVCSEISEVIFRNILDFGRAVFIFDGIDEVINISRRARFVSDVLVFSGSNPLCPILVTSRRVGYDRAPLPGNFKHYELSELSGDEPVSYFRKLSSIIVEVSTDKLDGMATEFSKKTANTQDLLANPLMVALMTWLFHERGGEIPATRAKLFRACAELLFEQWDKLRDIEYPDLPEAFEISRILPNIAWDIYQNQSLTSGVSREWLQNKIYLQLKCECDVNKDSRARRDAKEVVEFITGRAWIMTEAGHDIYRFTHRTFLEYFFARAINDRCETLGEVFELVSSHILDGTWAVSVALALDERASTRTPIANQIACLLLNVDCQGDELARNSLVDFLIQSLEYLSGAGEAELRYLIKRVVHLSNTTETFKKILSSSNKRRSVIVYELSNAAASAMSQRGALAVQFADWLFKKDIDEDFLAGLRSAFASITSVYANEDVVLAKIRLEVVGTHAEQAAQGGARVWDSQTRIYRRTDTSVVDLVSCLRQLASVYEGKNIQEMPMAQFAVALSNNVIGQPPVRMFRTPHRHVDTLEEFPIEIIQKGPHNIALAAMICIIMLRDVGYTKAMASDSNINLFSEAWDVGRARFSNIVGDPPRQLISAKAIATKKGNV